MRMGTRGSIAVFIAGFCTFLNMYPPQAFLSMLALDLGSTSMQVGLSITVTLLAVSLIAPIAGAISDRLGRKRLIVGACLGVTLPTLLIVTSTQLEGLLIWRFLQGLLLPFIFTVTVAYIGDECEGSDTIRVAGIYASGTILGGFSGRFIGGVVSELLGWRMVFVVLATMTALCGCFIWRFLPKERAFQSVGDFGATLRAYGEHLRNPRLLATCAIGFGMLFSLVACFTFVNFHLGAAPYHLSPSQLGSVFTVYLMGMVTTPLATRIAVSIGRRRALLAAVALSAIGLSLSLSATLWVIVLGLALASSGMFTVQALALGFIGALVPRARSSAVGLYVTIYYIGGAIGGVAPAGAWRWMEWPGVVVLMMVVFALMAILGTLAWRTPTPFNSTA